MKKTDKERSIDDGMNGRGKKDKRERKKKKSRFKGRPEAMTSTVEPGRKQGGSALSPNSCERRSRPSRPSTNVL